jgi:DHA3 family macrolide efflux protein-like MFS transporter
VYINIIEYSIEKIYKIIDKIQLLRIMANIINKGVSGMDASSTQKAPPRWALNFFTIWFGQSFSILGSQVVQFALIWWLTVKTGSATVLTFSSIAGIVPQVLLAPLAGVLVDRWNRRITMMIADGVGAAAAGVLAGLFALGWVQVWHVFLILFIRSCAGAFHWPSMQASTSLMVPKQHLSRIQGLNQMLWGALGIIAAPLGALVMDLIPLYSVVAIDVVTAALAIAPLFFVFIPQPERQLSVVQANGEKPSVWADMAAGWRYVTEWKGVMILLLMATLINLLVNPAFALLPLLVKNDFHGNAARLAAMESAMGFGMMAGGLTLGVWGGFRRRILTTFAGLIGMGTGVLLVGVTPASLFVMAVVAMFLTGFMNPITNGPVHAVLQAVVAPEMQGRVFTLVGSIAALMSPIGLLIAGPLSDVVGVRAWFIVGGIATAVLGVVCFFIPAAVHIEDGRQAAESPLPVESQPPADEKVPAVITA